MLELLEYVVFGKLAIFFLQRFPFQKIFKSFNDNGFFGELVSCDLCLGFWVFFALAFPFNVQIQGIPQIPILSQALIGMAASFILHVFSAGWKSLYNVTVIGG